MHFSSRALSDEIENEPMQIRRSSEPLNDQHCNKRERTKTSPTMKGHLHNAHKTPTMAACHLALVLLLASTSNLQAAVLVQSPVQSVGGQSSGDSQISQSSSPATNNLNNLQSPSEASQPAQAGSNEMGPHQPLGSSGIMMGSAGGLAAAQSNQVPPQMGPVPGPAPGSAPLPGAGSSSNSAQPLTLPKINIYASRSEVKKLLGIDTSISYITNGQLNTYPLGFSIPMGYHLSDMIFTWQNLGPTSVNYSISLVIGNVQAVERPLINITRSGLIPRHEQVFKITLPCSGKITDEVDVQVLINIMGLVPVTSGPLEGDGGYGAPVDETDGLDQSAADYQLARAVQQQNELLAAAQASTSSSAPLANSSADQMQADQQLGAEKRPQMRMVSHTLAIKRKKICTMHPVPVQPMPRQPEIRPPNQPPPAPMVAQNELSAGHVAVQAKWPGAAGAPDQQPPPPTSGHSSASQQQPPPPTPLAEPAHQPIWSMTEQPLAATSTSIAGGQTAPAPPQGPPNKFSPALRQHGHHSHHQHHQASDLRAESVVQRQDPHKTPTNWTPATLQQAPGAATNQQSADGTNPLIELLRQQTNAGQQQQQQQQQAGNPLLLTLIVMSLIISLALIALLMLGSSSSAGYSSRKSPLDKLTALTNCIWRRTSAGSRAVNKCTKNVAPITIKSGIIGTFNGRGQAGSGLAGGRSSAGQHESTGLKSNVSSISGLSAISGLNNKHHHQTLNPLMSPYCQKQQQQQQQQQANYNTGFYHHYQHPPDLLLGGQGANAPAGLHNNSLAGPYQITMSSNRMTKLFLANPTSSGTYSVDNNYMPITTTNTSPSSMSNVFQAPHSDSGSVYQTIY